MTLLEQKAIELLQKTFVISMSSITEAGYPRVCALVKLKSADFTIWVSTAATSQKVKHYQKNPKAGVMFYNENDSVTLNGVIDIIEDEDIKKELWGDWMQKQFPGGVNDPNYCVLRFTATEATIYIDGGFETFTY